MVNTAETGLKKTAILLRITVDILMLIIVLINLVFLIFDWSFEFVLFNDFVKNISTDFVVYYRDEVHADFLFYESIFVSIFLTELLIQWLISVLYKRYAKWWFYPVVHWYDVLGCVPAGYFVWLRFFRIFAMTYRLHKRGVINLRKTEVYKQVYSIYEMFVHDASDRALVELIESVQREMKNDDQENVISYGIKPDQHELAKALSVKIQDIVERNYHQHNSEIKGQIEQVIKVGFDHSEELKKLEHIPFVGSRINNRLEKLVSDISVQLSESLLASLASDEIAHTVEKVINTSIDSMLEENNTKKTENEIDKQISDILISIADRSLEKLKADIHVRRKERMIFAKPEIG